MFTTIGTVEIPKQLGYILSRDVQSYEAISKLQITLIKLY